MVEKNVYGRVWQALAKVRLVTPSIWKTVEPLQESLTLAQKVIVPVDEKVLVIVSDGPDESDAVAA